MKSIFFEKHGEIDTLKYGDLPEPKPTLGSVTVKVKAVALNHLDIWVRRGWKGLQLEMPHITGSDIAGELLTATGGLSAGTPVVVNPGVVTVEDEWVRRGEDSISPGYKLIGEQMRGGLAELVSVPAANVFKMPESLSFEDACAPLLVGTTCWRMLCKCARLLPGESVLVVGSGGGVNSLSIVLSKAFGASVIALAGSDEKGEHALRLGASNFINYKKNDNWAVEVLKITKGRGVDVVIDNVGHATFPRSLVAVRRGGRIVTVGNTSGPSVQFDNRFLFTKQVSLLGSTMGSRQDFLDAMHFIWTNNIKVPIDRVEPLKEGIRMVKYLEEGRQFGKIVLKP